jgi:hypothetical protein
MDRHLFRAALATLLLLLSMGAQAQLGARFAELEAKLRLNAAQKVQFDAATAATQRALLSVGLVALEMKGRLAAELARDRPDVEGLLRDPDAMLSMVRPHFRDARAEWSKLYAMMDDEQVAIARDYVDRQFGSLERLGTDMLRLLRERLRP